MNPTLTLSADGIAYAVTFDRWDALQSSRARWCWSIASGSDVLASGDDLTTVPREDGAMLSEALGALLTFLAAALESVEFEERTGRRGENADLFPRDVLALLDHDTVTMLAADVEGMQ